MSGALTHLRDQIDEVDKSLLSLLAKRLQLVAEVGEVKSQHGLPVYRRRRCEGASVNDALCDTLLHLVAVDMDTNILGRHGMEALRYAQAAAKSVLRLGGMRTPAGRHALEALDEDFIARWISPGGSADLIAVTHFLYEVECRAAGESGAAGQAESPCVTAAISS